MFHRHSFGDPCDRQLAKTANRLKIDIFTDGEGGFDVSWELHGCVSNCMDEDDSLVHVTKDTNFVETLVAMFTAKRKGGAQ